MKKINLSFLFIVFFIFFFHGPYLPSKIIPIHDTLYVFTFFYPFYNEWFFHHELVQWFPYNTYGLPANFYQIWALTPVYYLLGVIGSFLKIENVLAVFKAGILSDLILYGAGLYWLGKELYTDKRTIFLICLSAVASVAWNSNINVGFRFYYVFPLVSYFLVLFYKERRPEFIWIAGMAALIWWVQGSVLYHVMGGVFAFFVFLMVLFLATPGLWRVPLRLTRNNGVAFLLFLCLLIFIAYYYKQSLFHVSFYAPGRSAQSGVTSLNNFLTYGGNPTWKHLFEGFFLSSPPFLRVGTQQDTSIYFGVAAAVFFVWALIKVRSTLFLAFLVTGCALTWLSFGGNFAKLCFYFPGMSYYRHLGFMMGLVKVAFLVCAGFGLDRFWKLSSHKKKNLAAVALWSFLFGILFFKDVRAAFLKHWGWICEKVIASELNNPYAVMLLIVLAVMVISVIAAASGILKRKDPLSASSMAFGLMVMFITCDFLVFQGRIYDNVFQIPPYQLSAMDSLKVHKFEYLPVRVTDSTNERQKKAWILVRLSPSTAKYATSFNLIQLDHCDPVYRPDIVTDSVIQLITVPNVKRYLTGCFYPKMRLVKDSVSFTDPAQAAIAIATLKSIHDPVVISNLKEGYRSVGEAQPLSGPQDSIVVSDFRPNGLTAEVNVTPGKGSWLVYDDAYYPHWRAEVNGREVPIQQAYFAFKAVYLPQGESTVRFFYDPRKMLMSKGLAVINLIFALLYCAGLYKTVFTKREKLING